MEKYDESFVKGCLTQSLEMFKELRLQGMAVRWLEAYKSPNWASIPSEVQMYELLKAETERRRVNAIKRLIRKCNLPKDNLSAEFELVRHDPARKIDQKLFTVLSTGDWMWREPAADLVICGATGVGKSYMAVCCIKRALAHKMSGYFVDSEVLFENLKTCRINGTLQSRIDELSSIGVLVLDDFLLKDMSEVDLSDLLHIICGRKNNGVPTIFTSQYPLNAWKERMKVSALTEAIIDRLEHTAYQFLIQGPSQREKIV